VQRLSHAIVPDGSTRLSTLLFVAAAALSLSACAERGDFGRVKPGLWNDTAGPFLGKVSAMVREDPVSWSMMTDDEKELRNRAWQFITPTRERWGFEFQAGDLANKRIIPVRWAEQSAVSYHEALKNWSDRSQRSRYARLREDIENDRLLLGGFVAVACRVQEMDRVRVRALDRLEEQDPYVRSQAEARVTENQTLVRNVFENSRQRLDAYRYSLEHLVVESPDRDAVKVERVLTAYDADRAGLERCATRGSIRAIPSGPDVRFMPKTEAEKPPK
jgi:hypothetical protein